MAPRSIHLHQLRSQNRGHGGYQSITDPNGAMTSPPRDGGRPIHHHDSTQRRGSSRCCHWICSSILILSLLVFISNLHDYGVSLGDGDVYQIKTSFLTKEVEFLPVAPHKTFRLYALDECPPLDDSKKSQFSFNEVELIPDSYWWQSMDLLAGSTVDVSIIQDLGVADVFLLRGKLAELMLERGWLLEQGWMLERAWKFILRNILLQQSTDAWENSRVQFTRTVDDSDTYIILVRSITTVKLELDYHIQKTNYNLHKFRYACSDACSVTPTDCMLVEGRDSGFQFGYTTTRRWSLLGGLASIPLALGVLLCCKRCVTGAKTFRRTPLLPSSVPSEREALIHPAPYAPVEAQAVSSSDFDHISIPVAAYVVTKSRPDPPGRLAQ